jgi:hypothetical protein
MDEDKTKVRFDGFFSHDDTSKATLFAWFDRYDLSHLGPDEAETPIVHCLMTQDEVMIWWRSQVLR